MMLRVDGAGGTKLCLISAVLGAVLMCQQSVTSRHAASVRSGQTLSAPGCDRARPLR